MSKWYETLDDDLWLNPDSSGESEAETIYDALGLIPGMKVLDIPSCAGRIAVQLAGKGLEMTCVDLRETFLEKARNRFLQEGLTGDFICRDMREVPFQNCFNGICNWQGSFGYFSDEENLEFLKKLNRALKPGGRIIIDQPSREYVINTMVPEYRVEDKVVRTKFDFKRNIRINIISVDGREKENISEIRLYSAGEMEEIFQKCGLRIEKLLGEYTGEEFTSESKRLVVVGVKEMGNIGAGAGPGREGR